MYNFLCLMKSLVIVLRNIGLQHLEYLIIANSEKKSLKKKNKMCVGLKFVCPLRFWGFEEMK